MTVRRFGPQRPVLSFVATDLRLRSTADIVRARINFYFGNSGPLTAELDDEGESVPTRCRNSTPDWSFEILGAVKHIRGRKRRQSIAKMIGKPRGLSWRFSTYSEHPIIRTRD